MNPKQKARLAEVKRKREQQDEYETIKSERWRRKRAAQAAVLAFIFMLSAVGMGFGL